ncbi:MAG: branched-chain amino acid ABC transporter permease [Clostridia bacterium]
MKKNWVFLIGIALLAILPLAISSQYIMHLLILIAINVIYASSLNLISGYVGELSLGHAAFAGLAAYTTALISLNGGSAWLGLIAGILVTLAVSYFFGKIVLRLRGAYFVITSSAFQMALFYLASNWLSVTRGPMGLLNIPKVAIGGFVFESKTSFYFLSVIIAIIVVVACRRLVKSPIGETWVAVRENENLAAAVGINRAKYTRIAFVFAGVFAGIGGWLIAHYIGVVSPDNMSYNLIVSMMLMVVIGGRGTIAGPVIGAVLITLLPEYLRWMGNWRMSVYGLILFLMVIFLPGGIMQLWSTIKNKGVFSSWVRSKKEVN